jgi:hypothetical protein
LCLRCGGARGRGSSRVLCAKCRDKERVRTVIERRWIKEKRLCLDCRQALSEADPGICAPCAAKRKKYQAQRRADLRRQGRCIRCGAEPIITPGQQALGKRCFLKQTAHRHLGSTRHWSVLAVLWARQKGACPYTGSRLRLGVNASLGHINPVSRFPEERQDPNNLQWVHYRINEMKRDWTRKEFLAFVRRIVKCAQPRRRIAATEVGQEGTGG